MQFTQTAEPRLYSGADDGRVLFLLPEHTAAPPASISVADSWALYPLGVYIFLGEPITGDLSAFARAAWTWFSDRSLESVRFVWIADPSAALSGYTISLYQRAGTEWTTRRNTSFDLHNLALLLRMNTRATVDAATEVITFGHDEARVAYITADNGGVILRDVINGSITVPLSGPRAGCLCFPALLAQTDGVPDLVHLDVGLRQFFVDADFPAAGGFFMKSLRYPVFATEESSLQLYASIDPLSLLDPARTCFAFHAGDVGLSGAEPAGIPSHYRSTFGQQITLAPRDSGSALTTGAKLVFAARPHASPAEAVPPLYLVPMGDFELTGAGDLLCGLSGVESIRTNEAGTVLTFYPGEPAFATGFVPGQPAGATTLMPVVSPTTAFASVTHTSMPAYYAQPDQAVLFNYPSESPSGVSTLPSLAAVPVLAGSLPATPSTEFTYPLLPYAGVDSDQGEVFAQLESQVVSPLRRAAIAAAPPKPVEPEPRHASKYSTTPQGLLITYEPGKPSWDEVVLAEMSSGARLLFSNVHGDLLTALQSNQLFLVISDPAVLQETLLAANATVSIGADPNERWNFDLTPSSWASFGTILILKFHNRAIDELVAQPGVWAAASKFNTNPIGTAQALRGIIEQARTSDDPDFATFNAAVSDPDWNGILALNVKAPLSQLPAQLAGLAAGIDPRAFYAHHVGIHASKIVVPEKPADLSITDSSIFGLIHYEAPTPLQRATGAEYQFQVELLKVLFNDSAVVGFSSIIDLQINRLFSEATELVGSPGNVVQLYGVYQKREVNGRIEESYIFRTLSGLAAEYTVASRVLNAVLITDGQFVTVSKPGATQVTSQFVLAGQLDFIALDDFDAFSFGRDPDAKTATGLRFQNLLVAMTSDNSQPDIIPQFSFDAAALTFDPATSRARENSFYRHFPLSLNGLTQGKSGSAPTDLGFMAVQTPLSQTTLQFPWYSLDFNLDLGSQGGLAAQADFVATLTLAWSPSSGSSYSVFIGLRLPGSSGAKRVIRIQGIFEITFRNLAIIATPEGSGYVLILYGIAFEFLSFSFPPSGQVNFVLFGDPGQSGAGTNLGWYAAYAKSDKKQAGTTKPQLPATTNVP